MSDAFRAMRARQIRLDPRTVPRRELARPAVNHLRLAVFIAQEQPALLTCRVFVDQDRGIGKPCQILQINLACLHQTVNHRQDEQTISPRRDPHPVIRNRVIACADRVHAHNLGTVFLGLADAHFDRV